MTPLQDRAVGALVGAAVGDALGGATEGWTPEQIRERYDGWVTGIVPPYFADWRNARPIAPYHKGDGHVTDDTLMTHALVRVYERAGGHLDAYSAAEYLVPEMMGEKRWIPELEAEALPLQRVFLAEKWLALRLHYGHVDPREAGVGNIVNCGAAMYMAPVGIVNAADPDGAYAEAIDLAGAHQSSYGREAAGVLAATVAEAMRPGATPDSVVATAVRLAKDGTRAAIESVCERARGFAHWEGSFEGLRDAVRPFDTVADTYRDQGLGARRPSRTHSIEELPLALAFLLIAGGGYSDTVIGAVNYGRDADSIASMGGAIAGALGGIAAVPADWRKDVAAASRLDLEAPGLAIAAVAERVHAADRDRRRAHEQAFAELLS
ncbi:ADP-ribosylglycohydrolase family protein [Actinoallomurus sp. NPDC050550]|uniref:ADP-ribosylglycohydrolase family protein n=1 Tax=Actinoallomurus sp. NPDC050550 TaxID=3154937 RepID=UPI0033C439B7